MIDWVGHKISVHAQPVKDKYGEYIGIGMYDEIGPLVDLKNN